MQENSCKNYSATDIINEYQGFFWQQGFIFCSTTGAQQFESDRAVAG